MGLTPKKSPGRVVFQLTGVQQDGNVSDFAIATLLLSNSEVP
jgi:hypothetical protein